MSPKVSNFNDSSLNEFLSWGLVIVFLVVKSFRNIQERRANTGMIAIKFRTFPIIDCPFRISLMTNAGPKANDFMLVNGPIIIEKNIL